MASMQEEAVTSIVKSDRAGRSRYTAQYRAEVVAAFETSGLSGPAFARQCGIKYPTFAAWVAKGRGPVSVPGPPGHPHRSNSSADFRVVLFGFSAAFRFSRYFMPLFPD